MTKLLHKENYGYLQKTLKEPANREEVLNNLAVRTKGIMLDEIYHPFPSFFFFGILGFSSLCLGLPILFMVMNAPSLEFTLKLILVISGIVFLFVAYGMFERLANLWKYKEGFFLQKYRDLLQYGEIVQVKVLSSVPGRGGNHQITYEIIGAKGKVSEAIHYTQSASIFSISKGDTLFMLHLSKEINTLL